MSQVGQAAVSFLLTLTFVHVFSPDEFGVISGFWTIWILLMSMSRTVFGEQLIAQAHDPDLRRGYMDFGYMWTAVGMALSVVALVLMRASGLVVAVLCIALFVLSDIVRYQVMGGWAILAGRIHWLFPWDLLRALLCAAGLLLAVVQHGSLLAQLCCLASSCVWVALSLASTGIPRLSRALRFLKQKKRFEGLIALQFLTGTGASQLIPFMALQAFGIAQYGGIRLTQSLLSPITLLVSAVQPGLISAMSERRERKAATRFLLVAAPAFVVIAAVLAAAVVAVVKVGQSVLVPAEHSIIISKLIIPMSVLLALVVVALPGGAMVRVFRLGSASLLGQMIGVIMTAAFAFVALRADIVAFVWALAGGSAVTVITTYLLVFVSLSSRRRRVAHSY